MAQSDFDKARLMTALPVTGEFITDPEGNSVPVIDITQIPSEGSVSGRKKSATLVRRASAGEGLGQKFEGGLETFEYVTEDGDAIFVNSPADQYVPPSKDGGRLKFDDLEKNGFKITEGDASQVKVLSPAAQLLVGIVDARVCIKNAWGAEDKVENHQFLSAGATLKIGGNGQVVSGIDKEGMTKWGDDLGNDLQALISKSGGNEPRNDNP